MSYQGARAMLEMGVSRPTLYEVVIPNVPGRVNDYLRFFCKATAIPEVSTDRIPAIGHEAIGVQREQVTRIQYGKPFQITVIENSNFDVYTGIRQWFDTVASNVNNASGGGGPNRSQRAAYYDDVVADMTLTKLENPRGEQNAGQQGQRDMEPRKVLEVTFRNAYPVTIGAIQLGSDLFDAATEFTVDFTYETYNYE